MNKLRPLVKGIITGILMVISSMVLYYSKTPPGSAVHYIIYLLYAAGIIWTLVDYSRTAGFTGKFSDMFGQGFRCFIVVILIVVAFTAIFSMMHPEFAEEAARQYRADLVKKGDKLPADIDKLVNDAKKQYTTGVVYFTIFGYLIIGALINAVGSVILIRRK
jgi:hypothetical protein